MDVSGGNLILVLIVDLIPLGALGMAGKFRGEVLAAGVGTEKMRDSALQIFNGLVRQQPKNATFRYHLGCALIEKGDAIKAKKELESALADGPSPEVSAKIKELISKIG